jgi:two-component system OmpR family sensor kinase
MTLRLRLVLALVLLLTAGLALFGVATYSLYSRSQYQRLDDQVRSAVPFVTRQLEQSAGLEPESGRGGPGGGSGGGDDGRGGPPPDESQSPRGQLATYGALLNSSGTVLTSWQLSSSSGQPRLSSGLHGSDHRARLFTTGSASGSGRWRVYATAYQQAPGDTLVVAVPMGETSYLLHRLVLIEVGGGASLLLVLCAGAWLILRRGMRPLERMAQTASSISAGDLSHRVSPSSEADEVGQLGLALNTMLDRIQAAFAERDATEQRLRQFLADASHELRTPLTSIQGFAELFRIGPESDEVDLPTILRRIEEESGRMRELVEDLLLLARLDEVRPVERAPVDLAVLAADACTDAAASAPSRPITLDAPDPVVVRGDQSHLRQAIGNLVTNAVRHTPDGSPIEVSAHVENGRARVMVRDHGPGLDPEALAHAFDRFWQGDHSRTGTGTGLGLSIVAGVAAEHGGTATAANADDGGGLFELDLPVRASVSE